MTIKHVFQRIFIILALCSVTGIFLVIADDWRLSQHPAQSLIHELTKSGPLIKAYFSPDDGIQEIQRALIEAEQKSLDIAIFSFTDTETAQALIAAHKRGVRVRIVADRGSSVGDYSKILLLRRAGIPVHVCPVITEKQPVLHLDDPRFDEKAMGGALMHNKFIVFGQTAGNRPLLWTGSFNFTRSANARNQENVIILSDQGVINAFSRQFEKLLERSELL